MALISLTTDFGTRDEYVGVMKAVILSIAPALNIVDISHQVGPQDRHQAAFLVKAAYPYFEAASIHVVVVDPGVGSQRRIVAMQFDGHFFMAPDNGICHLILDGRTPEVLVAIDRAEFHLPQVSQTFHGRDIFAPVAAQLALGKSLDVLGTPVDPAQLHPLQAPPAPQFGSGFLSGNLVQVDHFGNLTTNIDHRLLREAQTQSAGGAVTIRLGNQTLSGLSTCYADAPAGAPLALVGSRGLLEIAVNQGNARHFFGASRGDPVRLEWKPAPSPIDD